jgi:hypothetical protein
MGKNFMNRVYIPNVSKKIIIERAAKIKPVVSFDGVKRYVDSSKFFLWDAEENNNEAVYLEKICDITTFHKYWYYGFFKPTLNGVLAQIPEDMLDVIAFEIVKYPKTAEDLSNNIDALNAGFHVATTTLYRKV